MSFKQTFLCDMSVDVKELRITHNKGEKELINTFIVNMVEYNVLVKV